MESAIASEARWMGWVQTWPGIICPVAVAACRSTRREKLLERGWAATPARSSASASWRTMGLVRVAGGETSR
eukprot:5028487-Alexandrium_andersonii.AAC.1